MDTRLLNAFLILAETGHFGEAASRLFISQPALTKQIKTLETQLDVVLFQRGRRGAELTPEGQYLLNQAQSVLREVNVLEKQARQLNSPENVVLNMGFGLSALNFITPLIARFKQLYPDITVNIDDMPSSYMESELIAGNLDLAFSRLPVAEPLRGLALTQEFLTLAIPIQNITTLDAEYNPLKYFKTQGLIQLAPEKGKRLHQQIKDFLAHHRLSPRVLQQTQDIQTQLALVAAGLGIALVPQSAERICDNQKVTLLPLSGLHTTWKIGIVWNNNIENKERDIFIKVISEQTDIF